MLINFGLLCLVHEDEEGEQVDQLLINLCRGKALSDLDSTFNTLPIGQSGTGATEIYTRLLKAAFCSVACDAPGFAGVGAGPLCCSSENFVLYTVPPPLVAAPPPPPLLRRRASGMGGKGTRERRRQARDGGEPQGGNLVQRAAEDALRNVFSASVVGGKK